MENEVLFNQVRTVRAITLKALETVTETEADIRPKGFNNTIRWQFGHILIVQSVLAANFAQVPSNMPDHFVGMFGNGTKPADWTQAPPSLEELAQLLQEQTPYILGRLGSRVEETLVKPFVRLGHTMNTIGELLFFSLYHEGVHNGAAAGLKRAIEGQVL